MTSYKNQNLIVVLLVASLLVLTGKELMAQDSTKAQKKLKNTIHFNITNPVIFGKSMIFGYERVVSPHQSFSVNFGTTGFPSLNIINADSIQLQTIRDESGYNFSVDYRFYLSRQNKFEAPHGVYIGPYYSYNTFNKKHSWALKTAAGSDVQVDSDTRLDIHTVGVEFGFQFIFWKRVALDLVLAGPGVASYSLKSKLGSNLSQADMEKFYEKLNDALADRFPGYSVVIDEGQFKRNGSVKTTDIGYRYMVQIGFRF